MPASSAEPRILEILDGFIRSKVLMTAYRMDIFTLLAEQPLGEAELFERLGLPRRSGTVLVNACLALGLLERVDGRLRTTPELAPYLVRGPEQPFRMSSYLIEYYEEVYRQLEDLEGLVRSNGASSTFKLRPYFRDVSTIDHQMAAGYSGYMASTVPQIAEVAMETFDFSPFRHLLDLCGSTGMFCRSVLDRYPHLRASFLDVPSVVEIGAREISQLPALRDRLRPIPGDMFVTELPDDVDVVTMCRSAHDWGEDDVARVFRRVHAILPRGGALVLIERMLPDELSPDAENLYMRSVYFLVKSQHNEYRTPSRYRAMLNECGFADVSLLTPARDPHPLFRGLRLVAATKA